MVTLFWQAESEMDKNYTAYLHLTGSDGELAAQVDQLPVGYPTSDWVPGEMVVARYVVPWPDELAHEEVGLRSGFYYLPTLEQLGEAAVLAEPGEFSP